jgi:hypothetical protein
MARSAKKRGSQAFSQRAPPQRANSRMATCGKNPEEKCKPLVFGEPLLARCGYPKQPLLRIAVSAGSLPDFPPPGRRRFRAKGQKRPWGTILIVGFLVLVVVGLATYFAIKGFPVLEPPGGHETQTVTPTHESREFNYRFVFPDSAWKQDNQARVHVKANLLAMRRTNPDAWFALAARDFKSRKPDKTQVIDEAVKRLESYFQQFEWDPAPDGSLSGRPAWVVNFQGKADNILMKGECYILTHENMTYWFTTWCPAKDYSSLSSRWATIRNNFSLLDDPGN